MSGRATVLLALLALLAGTAYFLTAGSERALPPNSNLLGEPRYIDPSAPVTHLLSFDPADVIGVKIVREGHEISVHHRGDKWSGVDDSSRFHDFLVSLQKTTELTTIDATPHDLTAYGLESPKRRVVLERRGGGPIVLSIGNRNPAGTDVYVRVGDGPVSLAGSLLIWEFDKGYAAITGTMPQS